MKDREGEGRIIGYCLFATHSKLDLLYIYLSDLKAKLNE